MLDIALVTRALEGSGQEASGVVLEEILRLSQAGEHRAAAQQAASALEGGVTDVRIVTAYLLGVFDERGPSTLPDLLGAVRALLEERWASVRPASRKERVTDAALALLFRSLKATLDFHEATRGEVWRAWTADIPRELPEQCAAACDALAPAIEAVLPAPRSSGELASLRTRASACLSRLPPPAPAPAPAPVLASPNPPEVPAETEAEVVAVPDEPDEAPVSPAMQARVSGPPARAIEVSAALEHFIRKLEAFESLVCRGDMSKAAIVAQDVRRVVEHFDPRLYLPALLAPHFRLLSAHIGEIAPHWEAADGPAWQALEQLYQVDLDAFVGS